MNYQILDVTTGTAPVPAKLYTYFLDNSPEIDSKRTRPAIVLCPGGGYRFTSDREAEAVAMQFLAAGIHVAILRYTVAPQGEYPQALREVAWSVAHIREHAAQYHVDPDRILVMGFSAGGHLAASYGMFWKNHTFLAEELGVPSESASSERDDPWISGHHIRGKGTPGFLCGTSWRPLQCARRRDVAGASGQRGYTADLPLAYRDR